MREGKPAKPERNKTMYILEKFNLVTGVWSYMNTFNSYKKACEARDMIKRRIKGDYRIRIAD